VLDWFGYNSVRVISGLSLYWVNKSSVSSDSVWFISGYGSHLVNKISGQFRFISGHTGFRIKSGHYGFGSVQFWISLISNFGSKSVQLFLMSVRV